MTKTLTTLLKKMETTVHRRDEITLHYALQCYRTYIVHVYQCFNEGQAKISIVIFVC